VYVLINILIILIYTIDKYLEVVLKFGLKLCSNHTLKNLIVKFELELSSARLE
jgi:hypothetical protein